jgi:hypothetical protein
MTLKGRLWFCKMAVSNFFDFDRVFLLTWELSGKYRCILLTAKEILITLDKLIFVKGNVVAEIIEARVLLQQNPAWHWIALQSDLLPAMESKATRSKNKPHQWDTSGDSAGYPGGLLHHSCCPSTVFSKKLDPAPTDSRNKQHIVYSQR